jgi:hypothetical protein
MPETDENKELKKLPPLTLSLIIASFVLVFAIAVGLLYPQYQRIQKAKEIRVSKTILLEEQKRIFPIYAEAETIASVKFEPSLPITVRAGIHRDKISTLSEVFGNIALDNNLEFLGNSLEIGSFKTSSNLISMNVKFSGELFDFRNCLIALVKLPFFDSIEAVKINTKKGKIKKYATKIKIMIDKNDKN